MKTYHVRCGGEVSFQEVTRGYFAQCPECFEDLFSFEVESEKIEEVKP